MDGWVEGGGGSERPRVFSRMDLLECDRTFHTTRLDTHIKSQKGARGIAIVIVHACFYSDFLLDRNFLTLFFFFDSIIS